MTGSTLATLSVPQPAHGGSFRQGQPRIIVMHSIECPIERGRALSVAQSMARAAQVSVHYLVDPGATVQGLDESLIGWGAGNVNSAAIHIEQSGYAAYTRAQWTTTDGLAQLQRAAALVKDIAGRHGIPLRWLTDAQLLAAWKGQGPGGLTTHAQCTRVIGGTTHTDPGPNYPTDLLLEYAAPKATQTPAQSQEDDMELTDKVSVSDALATPTAQTYSVAQILQKQVNYLSVLVRDVKQLQADVAALKGAQK